MLTDEIKARLAAQSLVNSGFTVFRNVMPDTPHQVIAIFEYGGMAPELFFSGSTLEQPSIQFRVRGNPNDHDAPRAQIDDIFQAVTNWGGFTQSGTVYLGLQAIQSPFLMNRDANERLEFCVNFKVLKGFS